MRKSLFFVILLLIGFTVKISFAQNNSSIDSIIQLNKYTFKIVNNELVGSGKDFLINEAKNSQFFMIGELHGNKETPKFTSAILKLLKPEGYNNFAVEIGPFSKKKLLSIIEQKNGVDSLSKFYKKYNSNGLTNPIPFFDGIDEVRMLEVALTNDYNIWGIDQEFVYAASFLFDDIFNKINKSKNNSEDYENLYKKTQISLIKHLTTKSKSKFNLLLKDKNICEFISESKGIDKEITTLLIELEKSWKIYAYGNGPTKQYFESNNSRAIMMKHYFFDYYKKALLKESNPKMILKMGSMHTTYGKNPLTIYDIGNTLYELAILNNSKSFNLALAGRYYIRSSGEKIDRLKYVPEYKKLFEHQKENMWTLLDLRPLKKAIYNGKIKIDNKKFKNLLFRYDSILMKTLTAATDDIRDYKK
ncbi:hypothetical protein [Aquimarina megaterium]|uniref:hypothetical protein n=1 Tax=Aquimarina megaterium TaxID=1443666 RepID=UPI0004708D6C|nr:hypothetical protein [Aquimarina megaterium]